MLIIFKNDVLQEGNNEVLKLKVLLKVLPLLLQISLTNSMSKPLLYYMFLYMTLFYTILFGYLPPMSIKCPILFQYIYPATKQFPICIFLLVSYVNIYLALRLQFKVTDFFFRIE